MRNWFVQPCTLKVSGVVPGLRGFCELKGWSEDLRGFGVCGLVNLVACAAVAYRPSRIIDVGLP